MDITFNVDMLILFALCIVMAIMQKKGMMTSNRFALILAAYFSYFTISAINAVNLPSTHNNLDFEVLLVFGIWVFVFPDGSLDLWAMVLTKSLIFGVTLSAKIFEASRWRMVYDLRHF